MKVKLFAPKVYGFQPCSFHDAKPELIEETTGGCGPGGFGDFLVPDTMYGLSVKPACVIHDWMYHFGQTQDEKELADRVFLNNLVRIVRAATQNKILLRLRLRRCKTYYLFVSEFGAGAFYNNINDDVEMREVEV